MSELKRPVSPSPSAKDEDDRQYGKDPGALEELDEKYPNRPRNHSRTLLFSELFKSLFNPLNENKTQPGPRVTRSKAGGAHGSKLSPHEQRRAVVERFISRWRAEVGNDIYPAMRLILPGKDRERGVYYLKEQTIGKLLVKVMKLDPKKSADAATILNWRIPGQTAASRMAGDFAGRCYEAMSKRQMRTDVDDLRIGDVNELLDKLAAAAGEAEQLPIIDTFYRAMNAEELMWLIRIMLKQMKVGATERTFLHLWHPDAWDLFNVSSSLRHVCWELWDPNFRLTQEQTGISLMQCFQPQLAQFQMENFDKMISKLKVTDKDPEFWIEEKLDGERMQMHMVEDDAVPGGYRFAFYSRKGKDYTYLYGSSFEDDKSALTRHLKDAFDDRVSNLILDGEMIAWDPMMNKMVAFGSLKTAALSAQKNPFDEQGWRPLFRVFDILYMNDKRYTNYTLRDRRKLLKAVVTDVPGRLEVHPYITAKSTGEIEPRLRQIIANSSEGLVLKNPRSSYHLNSRNDDWIKVKPEYLEEFGESLDCVVVGGYYGEGRRGGILSSFMCGLRVSQNLVRAGANAEKVSSFFKVGGGLKAEDYAEIRHHTDGKWMVWDKKNPPSEFIELAGGDRLQYERPDMWIRPSESIVISVKAASIEPSTSFAVGETLRFPRFRRLRLDRSWDSALSLDDFYVLKNRVNEQAQEKKLEVEDRRHARRAAKRQKTGLVVAGAGNAEFVPRQKTQLFGGLTFQVMSGSDKPKQTKPQIENLIKEHGGAITQRHGTDPASGVILIADKNVVGVASMIKAQKGQVNIIKPKWIFDCLQQDDEGFVLPYEESHLFTGTGETKTLAAQALDQYGDSYHRDVEADELREILEDMPKLEAGTFDKDDFLDQLEEHGHELPRLSGFTFRRCRTYLVAAEGVHGQTVLGLQNNILFGNGKVAADIDDERITHIVVVSSDEQGQREIAAEVRSRISRRPKMKVPRVVTQKWVEDCWKERTLVDEEAYSP